MVTLKSVNLSDWSITAVKGENKWTIVHYNTQKALFSGASKIDIECREVKAMLLLCWRFMKPILRSLGYC